MALLLVPQLLLPCNTVQAVEDAATVAAALAGCHDRPTAAVPARDTCLTASQRQSVKNGERKRTYRESEAACGRCRA